MKKWKRGEHDEGEIFWNAAEKKVEQGQKRDSIQLAKKSSKQILVVTTHIYVSILSKLNIKFSTEVYLIT